MIFTKASLIAGAVAVTIAGGVGFKTGEASGRGEVRKGAERAIAQQISNNNVCIAERNQHRAEIAKINDAEAVKADDLRKLLQDDAALRATATRRFERAAAEAAEQVRLAGERSAAAREAIQNVADQCAVAGVPSDVLRVLDNLIARPGAGIPNSDLP